MRTRLGLAAPQLDINNLSHGVAGTSALYAGGRSNAGPRLDWATLVIRSCARDTVVAQQVSARCPCADMGADAENSVRAAHLTGPGMGAVTGRRISCALVD